MKIDNFEYHFMTGAITSQMHGFTFTHSPECHIGKAVRDGGDFTNACDCFLSRIDITEINGVPMATDLSKLHEEQLRTKYWYGEYKDLRRRFAWMFAIALVGWGFSLARGIWGF